MNRWARAFLVIEDRRPKLWEVDGNAAIVACYQTRRAAHAAAGRSEYACRVLPIRVDLHTGFFQPPEVVITTVEGQTGAEVSAP